MRAIYIWGNNIPNITLNIAKSIPLLRPGVHNLKGVKGGMNAESWSTFRICVVNFHECFRNKLISINSTKFETNVGMFSNVSKTKYFLRTSKFDVYF